MELKLPQKCLLVSVFALLIFFSASCIRYESPQSHFSTDYLTNFEALWKALDEGYCFFPEKFSSESAWLDIHDEYKKRIDPSMSEDQFFDLMVHMMNQLKDGHVNLFAPFDVGRYSDWKRGSSDFFNPEIRHLYLEGYRTAGSLYYTPIRYNNHEKDSIGLIVIPSFSSAIKVSEITAILSRFKNMKGIIIDIRNNGGGILTNANLLTSYFINQPYTGGYMSTKIGPGHHDFGPLSEVRCYASIPQNKRPKPAVVLTNRSVYSAANAFTAFMAQAPRVYIVGDTTGGGGGLPISSELPNGWWLRYSGSRMYDAQKRLVEWGVAPDFVVPQTEEDNQAHRDALIEKAIKLLLQ